MTRTEVCIIMLSIGELILLGICVAQQGLIDHLSNSDRMLWRIIENIVAGKIRLNIRLCEPEQEKQAVDREMG